MVGIASWLLPHALTWFDLGLADSTLDAGDSTPIGPRLAQASLVSVPTHDSSSSTVQRIHLLFSTCYACWILDASVVWYSPRVTALAIPWILECRPTYHLLPRPSYRPSWPTHRNSSSLPIISNSPSSSANEPFH